MPRRDWGGGVTGRALLGLLLLMGAIGAECAPAVDPSANASRDIIRNYGPGDGFSQNAVNAIVQGRDGYLWLGTFGGLVRFDGDKFTTLRATRDALQPQDPSRDGALGSDRIVALREDSRARLWIGTEDGGLNLYHRGKFQQLPMCGGTCGMRALSPQVGNTIWVATTVGVFRVSTDTLQAVAVAATLGGAFSEVAVGSDGAAYLSGDQKGIVKVVGDTLVPVPLPPGIHATWEMRASGKYLWVRTNLGLYRLDPASQTWNAGLSDPGARPKT
jgi:ligand-binding sensor domain-containing protein